MSQALNHHFDRLHRRWMAQSANDNEFGGVNFRRNLELARTVIQRYGTKELVDLLERTRMGSHPEVIRLFWRIGKALPTLKPRRKTIGELFYPGWEGNP